MSPDDIKATIIQGHNILPQQVLQAKVYLLANMSGNTRQMVDAFVEEHGGGRGGQVVITPDTDQNEVVLLVARWWSLNDAARQAIWSLIGSGALVPGSERLEDRGMSLGWEIRTGGGASSSSWDFGPSIPGPVTVRTTAIPVALTDGDLYLASLDLDSLDPGVADSLRSAVRCFRHDFFLPAQVMLARAAEGAWVLAAEAVVRDAPDDPTSRPISKALAGQPAFHALPSQVDQAYRQPCHQGLVATAGVRPQEILDAATWTDAVRRARNAVHLDNEPPLPATWESTAALFMGAVPNLRRLSKIAAAG